MATSKKKRNISLDKEVVERFEYLYPKLTGIFCTRAIKIALQDKAIFEKIFFNESFIEVK